MSRVVKVAGAAGSSASAGLSTADVTKLVQDNAEWSLIKRYEVTANISNFVFPAADFDWANYWGWKMVFMNNAKYTSGLPYWDVGIQSAANVGRTGNGSAIGPTNNTSQIYVSNQDIPASGNLFHTCEMYRDSNDHRWILKWGTGMGLTGGYWDQAAWGYAVLEGGTHASIKTNGMNMQGVGLAPSANGNNYIYLYGSNLTKGAA